MNVLFLCIGNAGRSQMAQAFLERLGGHQVRSAGSRAERELHPEVVRAMDEIAAVFVTVITAASEEASQPNAAVATSNRAGQPANRGRAEQT